jgi:Fanconi anemia group M protein
VRFVGQANRGESGLSSGEQIETINSFREGRYNILVATSVGEEGLDIPSADLVIFYEPVGSETRTIQRRGRTGRRKQGDVVVLIAEGTRDEGAVSASQRRELAMKRSIHSARRGLASGPIDYSLLDSFGVDMGAEFVKAEFFISEEKRRHAAVLLEDEDPSRAVDDIGEEPSSSPLADPSSFRPRGQFGLEDFKI